MRNKKRALAHSVLALILCLSMLVGTTFAWFSDSVENGGNILKSGRLKVSMEYTDTLDGTWQDAADVAIFDHKHWEPGYTEVKYLRVSNIGNLAFTYQLHVLPAAMPVVDGINLSDVIDVYYAPVDANFVAPENRELNGFTKAGTLSDLIGAQKGAFSDVLLAEKVDTLCLALKMQEDAGNEYQNLTVGGVFNVQLIATQYTHESDSFGSDYDINSVMPELVFPEVVLDENVTVAVTAENGAVVGDLTIQGNMVTAAVPAGVTLADNATELTMTVTENDSTGSNVTLGENEDMRSLDVHIEGVAADNTVPMIIDLGIIAPKYLNQGNAKLYHVENGVTNAMTQVASLDELDAHNEFWYDTNTGKLVVAMATFSEVTVVADIENAWNGGVDYSWYTNTNTNARSATSDYTIANADQLYAFARIVGGMDGNTQDSFSGKTVTLISDINLGDSEANNDSNKIFYPIGYSYVGGDSTVNSFEGTFDGTGHTIKNFYQNTWEIAGDYDGTYYKDGMGLFGYVVNGTVQNLTVDNFSSDGEFTPTGVIAAYAVNSTFENIAITNCNPRVYNTGNGGIVGIGGNSDDPDTYKLTFTNITIDNTNTITALWGSWDVACGGLVGMFRGDGHVYMTNCHVAAQMDVYNDVCGNYQYYWYRYSGMMVGTNKNMTTDDNGYTVPETDKFHAKGCTVHFGEWNDYYYCEMVANSLASYTHDHQFSRLTQISSLDEIKSGDNWTKSGNFLLISGDAKTCYHIVNQDGTLTQHLHTDAGEETVNGDTVLKEDKQIVYLPFNQLFTGYGWGVKHIPVYNGEDYAFEGITILDRPVADSQDKNKTLFTNSNFVYRVGNKNAVSVGSLFAAAADFEDSINSASVYVTVDAVNEGSGVSGVFTANTTDWTKGTIQFSGTGPVYVTIQDYQYSNPFTIRLDVVDAVNAISATNATANNVVLLNDCDFSSLEVSGGYTLYGNGFTMTCSSDSAALDMGYAFVKLNNGTLDNVQIVCPNFDYAVLYKSNMTESGNRSETTDKTRYFNVKSGVMASGNSQILNSRISGGRAAVNVSGGNVVIDNSRIELGAVASILVGAANSLTLRDVTLVQKPTASTYDSNKTLMGFSVLVICNSEGNSTPITLEGTLVQNAWVDENDKQYVPSAGQSIISTVLEEKEYLHDIDGDGTNESLNLGFAYMPEALTSAVNTTTITDNRTNKDTVPYDYAEVSISSGKTYVYSYKNSNGTANSFKTESEYEPNKYSDNIEVTYSDTADGLTTGKSFGEDGWVYELNVDLDKLSGYALDFSKLSMSVNGVTVTDFKVDGNTKPTSPVAVTAGGTTYKLTATIDGKEYTATYKVTGTETSKESPSLVASNYEAALLVGEAGSTFSKDTWHGAAPALNGIQIRYWSVAEKQYKTITLSDYTPTTAGKQNGTNTTWTYSPANGDFTLTLTGGQVHSSNNVNAMPVVVNSKLYFVAAGSNGLVNYGNSARTIPVTYSFKDNNGGTELIFSHTWSIECANGNTAYDYSDFCNGTSNTFTIKSSNGSSCVTPDTLITLADGTQKQIKDVRVGEEVVAWNFYAGEYETVPVSLLQAHSTGVQNVLHLYFEDGTALKILGEHGIFDADLNTFIFIDEDDAENHIGHEFVKRDGNGFTTVELTGFEVIPEYTTAYTILSAEHYNVMAEGMFTVTPAHVGDNFFNPFDIGEGMKYDETGVQADIEKYGLYTYEDFDHVLTYEQFEALNLGHFKVSVGKGYVTYDGLIYLIENFINNEDFNI